jgi:hypothetical protein
VGALDPRSLLRMLASKLRRVMRKLTFGLQKLGRRFRLVLAEEGGLCGQLGRQLRVLPRQRVDLILQALLVRVGCVQ